MVTIELPPLAEFDRHKETILATLRDVYERGPESKPFDGEKAWRSLTGLARFHSGRGGVRQEPMPAADRIERLGDIAKALGRARRLVNRAMQNDVGDALYSSWWECTGSEYAEADGHFSDVPFIEREFKRVVSSLAALETAASRAADDILPTKRGRRAILSRNDIWQLGALYRDSTGSIPGAGDGPFATFVAEVLAALGRYNDNEDKGKRVTGAIKYESVVDAIKDTRQWALTNPTARNWGPSPFDEEK